MTAVIRVLYEADAKARLNFVNWYLHGELDEEIDSTMSLSNSRSLIRLTGYL
jgi:hypothetical protein